eukprot:TRINITY_DN1959_c0_g7_i1.p1 TRINITY_DN1959_c0_g7~~TRINITY_DN1959_c0_g7_i1.p1  ORF type:complete len:170 (+),score=37.92 TRINITY_DN1959_c0_g7_i1:38-511(+)
MSQPKKPSSVKGKVLSLIREYEKNASPEPVTPKKLSSKIEVHAISIEDSNVTPLSNQYDQSSQRNTVHAPPQRANVPQHETTVLVEETYSSRTRNSSVATELEESSYVDNSVDNSETSEGFSSSSSFDQIETNRVIGSGDSPSTIMSRASKKKTKRK